jgi:hypothetical protein
MRIVTVTEDYFNERPCNVTVDLDLLSEDDPYRKACEAALKNPRQYVEVSYELMQDFGREAVVKPEGQTIVGSITLTESGSSYFEDPFLPEGYLDEED